MSAPSSGSTTVREDGEHLVAARQRSGRRRGHHQHFNGVRRVISCPWPTTRHRRAPTACPSRDVLKALGDNTRYAIYLELARAARPLRHGRDRRDARSPRQHRAPAPRPHARGRSARRHDRRPRRGRPSTAPLLARRRRPVARSRAADGAGARPHGAGHGRAAAGERRRRLRRRSRPRARAGPAGYAAFPSALEALVDDLDRLGFDPVVAESDTRTTPSWRSPTAPSPRYAESHPDLVCGLHHGLVAGFVETMGDAEVAEFCSLVHRTPCQVELTSR